MPLLHQLLFDDVLYVFDEHAPFLFALDIGEDLLDLLFGSALLRLYLRVRLADGDGDLCPVVIDDGAVSLDDLHLWFPLRCGFSAETARAKPPVLAYILLKL